MLLLSTAPVTPADSLPVPTTPLVNLLVPAGFLAHHRVGLFQQPVEPLFRDLRLAFLSELTMALATPEERALKAGPQLQQYRPVVVAPELQ